MLKNLLSSFTKEKDSIIDSLPWENKFLHMQYKIRQNNDLSIISRLVVWLGMSSDLDCVFKGATYSIFGHNSYGSN